MRPAPVVLCLLAWGLAALPSLALAEEKAAPFSLSYADAGLTEITVKDGKLRYVWHTTRRYDSGAAADLGSLANYDRHQIDVWLTDKEIGRFRDWAVRSKVFDFDTDYPSSSPPGVLSRAVPFQSGLTVVQGEKRHGVSWVGDSKIPDGLATAIGELSSLADEIEKSRRK